LIAPATAREPFADDRFRFTAFVSGRPRGIDIGGIDEIQARVESRVEDAERIGLVHRPAENIATEHDGGNGKSGLSEWFCTHAAVSNLMVHARITAREWPSACSCRPRRRRRAAAALTTCCGRRASRRRE